MARSLERPPTYSMAARPSGWPSEASCACITIQVDRLMAFVKVNPLGRQVRAGDIAVAGMFIWPQIDDQRQRSLVTAGAQTTNTSEAVTCCPPSVPDRGWPLAASEAHHGA